MSETVETLTTRQRFSTWWQQEVKVRVKAIVYTSVVTLILIVSFQVQNLQLNEQRVKDVENRQDEVCQTRIETRKDLREVLFYVVDLSDVLPGESGAETYKINRRAFIDAKYPELVASDCP